MAEPLTEQEFRLKADQALEELQRALLPPSLPELAGLLFAAGYRAAGEGNEVGGDFYHVFQVDEQAWWFAIGDVSGKGPEAAAIAADYLRRFPKGTYAHAAEALVRAP